MPRYLIVTDSSGETWAADVIRVRRTDSPDTVRVRFRLPNGDAHWALVRPDAIKRDKQYPVPWGPGGKFVESGLRPLDPNA